MKNSLKHLSKKESLIVEEYINAIMDENVEIRKAIEKTLPGKNMLAELHANTFEEFALMPIAREKGFNCDVERFDYTQVKPLCVYCGKEDFVRRECDKNRYYCNSCKKYFTANHKSISSGTNVDALTWVKVLMCIRERHTVERTIEYCGIARNTFYNIRNRLFYGMYVMLKDMKLYGNIEMDNTFIHTGFKGKRIFENEAPEGSLFVDDFMPYDTTGNIKHDNQACIFAAIDDYGHCKLKFITVGHANVNALKMQLGKEWFLREVPEKDPFDLFHKWKKISPSTRPGEESLFISDGEGALKAYARNVNMPIDAKVYKRKGRQIKLKEGESNIQNANNLHMQFKRFWFKSNHFSSPYLPGFLVFFEFIRNTGFTTEAIRKLFEILAKPGLAQSDNFISEIMYVPIERLEDENCPDSIRNEDKRHLFAAYLYEKKQRDTAEDFKSMTIKEMSNNTGFTYTHILKLHKKYKAKGVLDDIFNYYSSLPENKPYRRKYPPEVYLIYKYIAEYRKTVYQNRSDIKGAIAEASKIYGVDYKFSTIKHYFEDIEKRGELPPMPPFKKSDKVYSDAYHEKTLAFFKEFTEIENSKIANNVEYSKFDIYCEMGKRHGYSPETIRMMISKGRGRYYKSLKENK